MTSLIKLSSLNSKPTENARKNRILLHTVTFLLYLNELAVGKKSCHLHTHRKGDDILVELVKSVRLVVFKNT